MLLTNFFRSILISIVRLSLCLGLFLLLIRSFMAAIVLVLMTVHIYLVSTYYEMYEIEIRFHIFWTYKNFNGFFFAVIGFILCYYHFIAEGVPQFVSRQLLKIPPPLSMSLNVIFCLQIPLLQFSVENCMKEVEFFNSSLESIYQVLVNCRVKKSSLNIFLFLPAVAPSGVILLISRYFSPICIYLCSLDIFCLQN